MCFNKSEDSITIVKVPSYIAEKGKKTVYNEILKVVVVVCSTSLKAMSLEIFFPVHTSYNRDFNFPSL